MGWMMNAHGGMTEMNIEKLDLSTRTVSCLHRAGIETVEELLELSELDLLGIHGLGPKCLKEIKDKIGVITNLDDVRELHYIGTDPHREPNREAFLNGARAMQANIVQALQQAERRVKGVQRAAYEEARRLVEELDIPDCPMIGSCEGYRFFTGTMLILNPDPDTPPEKICGDWLYKPETGCWYCGRMSYPADICEIKEDAQ